MNSVMLGRPGLRWVQRVNLKNSHNLKVEIYLLFNGNLQDFSLGDSISNGPERIALRRVGWGSQV